MSIVGTIEIQPLVTYEEVLHLQPEELIPVVQCLKYHTGFSGTQLINITAVDYLIQKPVILSQQANPLEATSNQQPRFTVIYMFTCTGQNLRLFIKVKTDELTPLPSISEYFKSSTWYEREIWDLFGIFFLNNADLRRILNDYGFEGHPFRKDFPLTGYTQLQYDLSQKRLISVDVQLSSMLRK